MKNRLLVSLCALSIGVMVLTACGKKQSSTSEVGVENKAPQSVEAPQQPENMSTQNANPESAAPATN